MITNFNNFLTEKFGYPEPIKIICDIIKEKIDEHINYWYNRKGEANYNQKIYIEWNDIKDRITNKEDFDIFPVEEVYIHFGINKTSSIDYKIVSTGYYISNDNVEIDRFATHYIPNPKNNISDRGISINIECKINISKYINDYTIKNLKNQAYQLIDHEMFHAFDEEIVGMKEEYGDYTEYIEKLYKIKSDTTFSWFLYLMYFVSDAELRAFISNLYTIRNKKDMLELTKFKEKYFKKIILNDVDKTYQNIIMDLKLTMTDDKIENMKKNICDEFISHYIEYQSQYENNYLDKKLLELKGKTLYDFVKFYLKRIKKGIDFYYERADKIISQ